MKWNCPGERDHQIFLITLIYSRLSLERLKLSQAHLQRRPEPLKKYHQVIEDQVSKGIERVKETHSLNSTHNILFMHHLPHHAVVIKTGSTDN